MPRNKRLHFKDVNTLRFFAFLPIFVYSVLYLSKTEDEGVHYSLVQYFHSLTFASLDFFFFISAFLITSQGLREYKYTSKFVLKDYIIRRFLRIMPLFIIALVFTFLVHPWIMQTLKLNEIITPSGYSYWLLFPNYFSEFSKEQYIYLSIIWTIYMFIQFYLFWGFVLSFLKQHIMVICYVLIGVGLTARIVHAYLNFGFEFDTLSYGVPIGVGGIVAVLVRNESPFIEKIKNLNKQQNLVVYIIGSCITISAYIFMKKDILISFVPLLTCTFFGYLIIEQTFGKNSLFKLRNYKIFTHLGKISYGLIIYQSIISVLVAIAINSLDFDLTSTTVKVSFLVTSFAATWIAADLSYTLIEKPLLRLRREFKKI